MYNHKTSKMSTKAKNITSMYPASRLTKNSSRQLWVTFPKGNPNKALVFSSVLSRDLVRYKAAKELGVAKEDVRSRRVPSFRKMLRK